MTEIPAPLRRLGEPPESHCGTRAQQRQPAPDDTPGESRLVFLGDDEQGISLEVVAVETVSGDLRVVHAMNLRPKYQQQYEEAIPWRKLSSS